MERTDEMITLRSCLEIFNDRSGYLKLTDHNSKSTLFFKNGGLCLAFYRNLNSYDYKIGNKAVENLQNGSFFRYSAVFTSEKFVSEMEGFFPEARTSVEKIRYPEEEKMDEILSGLRKKEEIKREIIKFLESFISRYSEDLGYLSTSEIKMRVKEHLTSVFGDMKIDDRIYEITEKILKIPPQKDIKKDFEEKLSSSIRVEEEDETLKDEITSMVSELAVDYIKAIKEPLESKKQIKEKSIEFFSEVISDHLKKTKKMTPFERGIHLKELILKTPVENVDFKIKEHLEILKKIFVEKLELIKRCHLCGKQIEDGFLCEECKKEYIEHKKKIEKLKNMLKKVEILYIDEKIDEEEYNYLIQSVKNKIITLEKSGRKFTSLKEYVNL
ncbi:MAG: hypothetical protein J7J21_02790 [Methanomicrobia archaeon]|nr:hypothetical protein [Methanomicrobia archaeon]